MKKCSVLFGLGLILVTLTSMITNAWAQPEKNPTQSDPKAKAILDKVSAKYKAYTGMQATFTLTMESPAEEMSEKQSGKVYLEGDKYKLSMNQQEIICDNKTIWTHLKEDNEVQINNYEPDEGTITPTQLFNIWEEGYYYLLSDEATVGSKKVYVIDLTPKDKEKPFFKIRMLVDKTDHSLLQSKVFDKNGNRYTYEINDFVANPTLGPKFFSFDPKEHPGVDVVDLR